MIAAFLIKLTQFEKTEPKGKFFYFTEKSDLFAFSKLAVDQVVRDLNISAVR